MKKHTSWFHLFKCKILNNHPNKIVRWPHPLSFLKDNMHLGMLWEDFAILTIYQSKTMAIPMRLWRIPSFFQSPSLLHAQRHMEMEKDGECLYHCNSCVLVGSFEFEWRPLAPSRLFEVRDRCTAHPPLYFGSWRYKYIKSDGVVRRETIY